MSRGLMNMSAAQNFSWYYRGSVRGDLRCTFSVIPYKSNLEVGIELVAEPINPDKSPLRQSICTIMGMDQLRALRDQINKVLGDRT